MRAYFVPKKCDQFFCLQVWKLNFRFDNIFCVFLCSFIVFELNNFYFFCFSQGLLLIPSSFFESSVLAASVFVFLL